MKCDRHMWDTSDREWCWRCEELKIEENKKKYEDKFCNNSLQRIRGDKEIDPVSIGEQKNSRN